MTKATYLGTRRDKRWLRLYLYPLHACKEPSLLHRRRLPIDTRHCTSCSSSIVFLHTCSKMWPHLRRQVGDQGLPACTKHQVSQCTYGLDELKLFDKSQGILEDGPKIPKFFLKEMQALVTAQPGLTQPCYYRFTVMPRTQGILRASSADPPKVPHTEPRRMIRTLRSF